MSEKDKTPPTTKPSQTGYQIGDLTVKSDPSNYRMVKEQKAKKILIKAD